MACVWLISSRPILIILLFCTTIDCLGLPRQIVHVSLLGSDTKTCGGIRTPCRTIAMSVCRVVPGGSIVLNGNGTEQEPFDCKKLITFAHPRGIRVSKNVTITSLNSTRAHIKCSTGFRFYRSNQSLRITLTGITFFKTPLRFKDCSFITLINCTHENTKRALIVRTQNSLNVNLTIRGSLFQKNSLCVKIHFEQGSGRYLRFSFNMENTQFLNNGLNPRTDEKGAVIFSNETDILRKIFLRITVDKVMYTGNGGHFLAIDLRTAFSSEKYDDIVLQNNYFFFSRSLYSNRVRMANVTFFRLQCKNNYHVRCVTIQGRTNGTVTVKVHESSFYNNSACRRTNIVPIFQVIGSEPYSGAVIITNASFVKNNQTAMSITPNVKFSLANVTVSSSLYGFRIGSYDRLNENNFHLDVNINNCLFKNNKYDIFGLLNNTISVRFRVTNTQFDGKIIQHQENSTFGIRVIIPRLERKNFSETRIELEGVAFTGKPDSSFTLFSKGNKTIKIRRCSFRDGVGLEINEWKRHRYNNLPAYVTSQGAMLFLFDSDEMVERGCVDSGVTNNTHSTWKYSSRVLFEDTLFENNFGHTAGAVQIINGYVKFHRCKFINNFAMRNTGHVYVGYGSAKVEFNSCEFNCTRLEGSYRGYAFTFGRFLFSESEGPIKIHNTSFHYSINHRRSPRSTLQINSGGYFDMDSSSTMRCAVGSELHFANYSHYIFQGKNTRTFCRINLTTEIFSCRMCPQKMYSLQSGFSRGLTVNRGFQCVRCPFGAHCNGPNNILAKPNFWGYKIRNASNFSSLKFLPCPWEYCRPQETDSYHDNGYNSCHGFRSGVLCGQCATGFSETLFSTECRQSEKCDWNYLLWILMVLYTIFLTVYLLKKPPLVLFLKNQILWCTTDRQQALTDVLESSSGHSTEEPENGYLKIVFYFYQVADLLSTDSLEITMAKVPYISTLVAAFNFQVHFVDKGIGCPFPGLTAVTKELFLSALVFAAIAHVFTIYCLHLALNLVMRKGKPSFVHYVAVAVEILLLGYERLAETSLKLMHCVSIGSEWRLYFDGNIACWQWWQHGLLAFNAIFVVPFVGVLYWGSGKLYTKTITWKEFVGACIFPLPFLVRWLLKSVQDRQRPNQTHVHDECSDEISKILHGPFRPPSNEDQGTLHWESVLIGGRLILLTIRAFIPNSMICFLCMSLACVLMLVHHLIMKPFRDPTAGKLGTLSLTMLACIAIINLTSATLSSSAIKPEGPNKHIMVVLRWIVVAALCIFPAVVALLVLFALLSQLTRLVLFLKRKIYFTFRTMCFDYEYLDDSTAFLTD